MPATDYQGSSSPSFSSFGRSILNLNRDQIHSMEPNQNLELEAFHRNVSDGFHELSAVGSDELLSISWIGKLLNTFICCQEEFKVIMLNNEAYLKKSPMDRLSSEYFERNVKALDVCNAIRDGIEQIKDWKKQLEIVLCALNNQRTIGEGQFRRSKKALIDLTIGMIDEKEPNAGLAHRNRSFGRNSAQKERNCKSLAHFRSLSWSVSRSWSASKQIQSIGNNLTAPKSNEVMATNGLALAVYAMSSVLFFVMWVLVAAIPCQDRGLQTHFGIPKQYLWAAPILSLHERILEESKRKDRRNSCGLLKEIHEIERFSRKMNELSDSIQFPLVEEKEREVRKRVEELAEVYEDLKNGLDPLERQVREVFHRIVRSRTEGLDSFGR